MTLVALVAVVTAFGQAMPHPVSVEDVKAAYPEAAARAMKRADDRLGDGPWSVMDKTGVPPSGDKHDFYTLSPYHWPDPNAPEGSPYIWRDGEVNPEAETGAYDRRAYFTMAGAVRDLALAYRLTGDEKFAARAALLIRTWFLDEATRMNPNFTYAQWMPGSTASNKNGLIRGNTVLDVLGASEWIADSEAWSDADGSAWQHWLDRFAGWLTTSDVGKKEAASFNNHGTWFDVQAATFSLFGGDEDTATAILERVVKRRINFQIRPDGTMPFEMGRTKSWDYCVMNLDAFTRLAMLGERVGVDLWHAEGDKGGSIRKAIDYLVPFATGDQEWEEATITGFHPERLYPILMRAATAYDEPAYVEAAQRIPGVAEEAAKYHYETLTLPETKENHRGTESTESHRD